MRPTVLLALAALLPIPALAQAPAANQPPSDTVKQVIVYGDDPCPASVGEEIVVCARLPDGDRYRIPRELRSDPNDPKLESWAARAQSIEYVGRSGTDSCSPAGAGGFTGCFAQIARAAKAERKTMGDASWKDLVAEERARRLGTIDADSKAIEAQVKAEEARAQAAPPPAQPDAPPPADPGK
jgi:hypothetical protein